MSEQELALLRQRVRELEAIVQGVGGNVDAIILPNNSEQIYTLQSDERPYRLMVERMAEGALTVDAATGNTLYCNQAFATMIGQPLSSVMGRPFVSFLSPAKREEAARIIALTGSRRFSSTLDSDRGPIPVALAATTIESPEGTTICVIVSDLSQRRIAERLRRKQTALETEAQHKDEFIAMLGHELRNPLAPIQHAAELLNSAALSGEHVKEARATILRQTTHMRRLVDDLLDSARMSRGALKISRRTIDARDAVDAAVEVSQQLIANHPRKFEFERPSAPIMIEADDVRLTQVVTNLLRNAVKFSQEGDTIKLRLFEREQQVVIEVSDTGRGIEADMITGIFTAFVQEDVVFDRAVGGLGLGLALVKQLVELHGGEVHAFSEGKGLGSTFSVELPKPRNEAQPCAPKPQLSPQAASRTVMICDDNVDAAEMLALLLETAGHRVTTVHTGEAAVTTAVAQPPDILFLDIGLPGIDGYEVARQLRAAKQTAEIVIVALTGYSQAEDKAVALSAGCDLHLIKPVGRDELVEALAYQRPE